jgi:hypothetical protein
MLQGWGHLNGLGFRSEVLARAKLNDISPFVEYHMDFTLQSGSWKCFVLNDVGFAVY